MKSKLTTALLALALVAGLSLLLYPSVSDWWNSMHSSRAVAHYTEEVGALDEGAYEETLEAARAYNATLLSRATDYALTEGQQAEYKSLLNLDGSGIMGYIEIPSINVTLPIYHGVADSVLQVGVGHLDWSSLPVGGEGTHCVLSGHRGLPSAKLFTNLDRLVAGDRFTLRVLGEALTYEVDQILIVEPDDVSALTVVEGRDLCTLVTCTPYGINSHRLLVRGHRVEAEGGEATVTSDGVRVEPLVVAPVVAAPILLVLLIVLLATGGGARGGGRKASGERKERKDGKASEERKDGKASEASEERKDGKASEVSGGRRDE